MDLFRPYWGKARPWGDVPFHPLWAHGLDVAAAGAALAAARPRAIAAVATRLGWTPAEFVALWLHALSLHDIGKFSPLFQLKVPECYPDGVLARPDPATMASDPGHPVAGYELLWASLSDEAAPATVPPAFARWGRQPLSIFLAPILGHHGRPVAPRETGDWRNLYAPAASADAAFAYWQTAARLLPPPQVAPPRASALMAASWAIAGLTQLADWIGSSQLWFPYVDAATDLDAYWRTAQERAAGAVRVAGLSPAAPAAERAFASLTGIDLPPTEAQAWAASVPLGEGPLLAIVEDVTGGGKTEAALMLAHRLLAAGRAGGLYFALPTMATANAMFARVEAIAGRLYADDATPSLTLAHGRADLHPRFRAAVPALAPPPEASPDDGIPPPDEENLDGAAAATAWLMSESRKALLADLGVGTIDQALLAVLPARYQAVRLAGLADKVLIVDEAHGYDAYVGTELERLVAFHAAAGGSVIVLSATLPGAVRNRLVDAWGKGAGLADIAAVGGDDAYPVATLVAAATAGTAGTATTGASGAAAPPAVVLTTTALAARADLCRTVTITRVPDADAAVARIRAACAAGACVAWVRNAVDDAVEGAAKLREAGIAADLFHARFAMGDRQAIEARVLECFGKRSVPEGRRGRVLVATQVVEQSLDLDFDLVVSDLAPVDLMLQRAGRLWRHTARPRPIAGPEFVVVSPDPGGDAGRDWAAAALGRGGHIYPDHALLWRSAREIAARPAFRLPQDVRAAIEAVYARGEEDVPEPLHRRRLDAQGVAAGDRLFARDTLLDPAKGYVAGGEAWRQEAGVNTRLAEESRILRLARLEHGRLVPWHRDADPAIAWALSEVAAYEYRLKGRHRPSGRLAGLVAAARTGSGWGRFDEDIILLPLEAGEAGEWRGELTGGDVGTPLAVFYSPTSGLRIG